MDKVKCTLCNSVKCNFLFYSQNRHGRHLINTQKYKIYRCSSCGNVFLPQINIDNNYYKNNYLSDYYNLTDDINNSFIGKAVGAVSGFFKKHLIFNQIKLNKKINILDIGCGKGDFLQSIPNDKFNKFGIDINQNACNYCHNQGLNVICNDFIKNDFGPNKFEIITLWHMLEHTNNPQENIKKISQIIDKKGFLIIAVPNSESLGFKTGQFKWFHLDSPRHLFIPNQKNISKVLEQNGFKIIKIVNEFYDYPLDLFWSLNPILRVILLPFYPLIKVIDRETLTFICQYK